MSVGVQSCAVPVPLLCWFGVPVTARGGGRARLASALLSGAGDLRAGAAPLHPPERVPVPHASPPAHCAETELALAAGEHAGDPAGFVRCVHTPVCGVRDAAVRLGTAARSARKGACLTCPTTAPTWSPPTS